MTRLRLVVLAAGTGALLGTLPALAGPPSAPEARALALLARAADAASSRSWSGTQYVGTWRGDVQTSAVVDVAHRPGEGSTVRSAGEDGESVVVPELDSRLLRLLADHYDLAVAGRGRCAGRSATVVEARRPGGVVAGRFWLDAGSGLVLRREVYDAGGRRLASSAFVELEVAEPTAPQVRAVSGSRTASLSVLDDVGWQPPRELGGLALFDARLRDHDGKRVLHLAYSDGLSTLSLFAQRGALPDRPRRGFQTREVHGTRAWVQPTAPERVVWQGDGRVFTLVSDADPRTVRAAVGALPRDDAPRPGLLGRLGRGLERAGSWLNPFD